MTETALAREIARAVERIRPILAGRPPAMQGLILADLLAMWLSGHIAEDEDTTLTLRAELLAMHCDCVRAFTEANDSGGKDLETTP
jgi:hypothetical protein